MHIAINAAWRAAEKSEEQMTLESQKERALTFLKNFEKPDRKDYEDVVTGDFEYELMGRLPGVAPIRGKEVFLSGLPATLKQMFPNGLNMKFHTVIAEGPHVAIQCESNTIAGNGKKYANRYHFYFRFEGDRIAQVREYMDSNLVREVFMS
jgi:ketosteroid isomerase-like protein